MIRYTISPDIAGIAREAETAIDEHVLPLLSQAVNAVAQETRNRWMESVHRAKLWSGEKDAYAQSITYRMTGPFSAVVESDYKHAQDIETGRPAYDLKRMLDTSHKVRRSTRGRRILIIPFRHNIPGANAIGQQMPEQIYEIARNLTPSRIVGQSLRRAGEIVSTRVGLGMRPLSEQRQRRNPYLSDIRTRSPVMVAKRHYQWGDRLPAAILGPNQRGKTDRFAGMVRFDTSAGGRRHSTYMTFRTMADGQSGWIIPAKPGLYLAKKVADEMRPLAETVFTEAVKRSLG